MSEFLQRIRQSCSHIRVLPLEAMRLLPEAREHQAGLYFLWLGETLQYIGRSRYLEQRVLFQWGRKRIPFGWHSCLVLHRGRTSPPDSFELLRNHHRAYFIAYETPFNPRHFSPEI